MLSPVDREIGVLDRVPHGERGCDRVLKLL